MSDYDKLWHLLAHTDLGSLPNDWTLLQIAEARIDDMLKLRDQVRDTCKRAEAAEAENDRLREALAYIVDLDSRLSGLEDAQRIAARALSLAKEAGQ